MSAFKEVPRGYLSSFCGVHAPIAAPLIIIPRWSQCCSRKSHARGSYRATTWSNRDHSAIVQKRGWINRVSCRYADSDTAIPPPRLETRAYPLPSSCNCKLKRALTLPFQGLLISIRTSGCIRSQMCVAKGEIFAGILEFSINNSIWRFYRVREFFQENVSFLCVAVSKFHTL